MLQHDLRHVEFPRTINGQGDTDRSSEIHFWCICGEFYGIVEHTRLRVVSDDFQRHLKIVEGQRNNRAEHLGDVETTL